LAGKANKTTNQDKGEEFFLNNKNKRSLLLRKHNLVCKKYVSKVDSATKLARPRNKSKEREHCNKASKSKNKDHKWKIER
jgi:hypothetical protein